MTGVSKDEYMERLAACLREEKIEPHVHRQIVETVEELLKYYDIEYVEKLLPSLFEQ